MQNLKNYIYYTKSFKYVSSPQLKLIKMSNTKKLSLIWMCFFLAMSGIEAQVKFIWPLKQANGYDDPSYYVIGNYVDHHNRLGFIRDYNNGYRTYDGHTGTDIALYPDAWRKKWAGQVDVVAAAAGQIISKRDGYPDNNCSWQNQPPSNKIVIRHVDGTETTYKQFKKNSLTTKNKWDWVAEGEYLGKVASSGTSTGPHLHFEVRDAQGNVIDPFFGPNNPTTNISRWKNQLPYYDGGVNKVYIGSDYVSPPNTNCFAFMNLHAKNTFKPGQRVYTSTFIRTPAPNALINIYVFRPDGTLHTNNTVLHQYPSEAAIDKGKKRKSTRYRSYNLPFNAQVGTWTVIVTYNSLLSNADIVTFEVEALDDLVINFKPTENNGLGIQTKEPLPSDAEKSYLQRSYDAENWTTIDEDIHSADIENWTYEDVDANLSATIYYRINSINKEGIEQPGTVYHWTQNETKASTGFLEVSNLSVDLYPNPTRAALQMVTTDISLTKKVEIVNLSGQVLATFDWEKGSNVLQLQVDFLPAGLYAAHIIEKGRKVVKPFVKSE